MLLFRCLFFGVLLLTLSACHRSIHVATNTYTNYQDLPSGFPHGSSFCLASGKNDLLTHEIKMKLESVLRHAGYTINDRRQADYYLVFDYEIESKEGSWMVPITLPGTTQTTQGNVYGRKYVSYDQTTYTSGSTTMVQQNYTYYIRKLTLAVYNAKIYRANNNENILWSGSAISVGESADFRLMVDYLIAAILPHFGKATNRIIDHRFDEWFSSEHADVADVRKTYISK